MIPSCFGRIGVFHFVNFADGLIDSSCSSLCALARRKVSPAFIARESGTGRTPRNSMDTLTLAGPAVLQNRPMVTSLVVPASTGIEVIDC